MSYIHKYTFYINGRHTDLKKDNHQWNMRHIERIFVLYDLIQYLDDTSIKGVNYLLRTLFRRFRV
jgi:hypothetical protein